MLTYPNIDPVILKVGPLAIHWYGLMYLLAIAGAWYLARGRVARFEPPWPRERLTDLVFWCALGIVAGGRLGYMLFYSYEQWLADPLVLFKVWQGGMSFHGGLLGVILAMALFARKNHIGFWRIADLTAPVVPIGLGLGRIGNFINAELWGKPTDLPWGMIFPLHSDPAQLVRHPTQLYEAFLEGFILFWILWLYSSKPRPVGSVAGLFLVFYGIFRFLVELLRMPDAHIGYLAFGWLTMGQLLCLPMIIFGLWLCWTSFQGRWNNSPKG